MLNCFRIKCILKYLTQDAAEIPGPRMLILYGIAEYEISKMQQMYAKLVLNR